MRYRIRAAASLLFAAAIAGCDDVTDIIPGDTYDLVQAEGQDLPAVVFDQETEFGHLVATAVSGSMTLRESTYTERMVVDVTVDGAPFDGDVIVVSGEYTADGPLLTFHPDRAGTPSFTGTLSGVTLTTVEVDPEYGELTLVWQR